MSMRHQEVEPRVIGWTAWLALLGVAGMAAAAACSAGAADAPGGGEGGTGGDAGLVIPDTGVGGMSGPDGPVPLCTQGCQDFPAEPIYDELSVPAITAAEVAPFADPSDFVPGTLCVTEPQLGDGALPGSMFPANWLRPRFKWNPAPGDTLFEIRLSNEIELSDLVVYTRATTWIMPQDLWLRVAQNVHTPITVTIRGTGGGTVSGASGTFRIAPVYAGGSMVFWATSSKEVTPTASRLVNFAVGSEYVAPTLDLGQVQTNGIIDEHGQQLRSHADKPGFSPGQVQCIGCHVSTPDGDAVVFTDDWPWDLVSANVDPEAGAVGATPSYVTDGGLGLMNVPFQGIVTMTPALWGPGQRIIITSRAAPRSEAYVSEPPGAELAWVNLEAAVSITSELGWDALQSRNAAIAAAEGTGWGILPTGDPRDEVTPDWSHDGQFVAYTSTTNPRNGHLNKLDASTAADIYVVPANNGAGGQAAPLAGASDPVAREYYPAYSADDAFIAFNRVESQTAPPYYNADGEIWIVPSGGGTPTRLAANDPPTCTGQFSPGVTNSWAKWSPIVRIRGGQRYYFLIFSSARYYDGQFSMVDPYDGTGSAPTSQLYMAAIVVDEASGAMTTYPAVYLWNQNSLVVNGMLQPMNTTNLTPAWDEFRIPPPPPPE